MGISVNKVHVHPVITEKDMTYMLDVLKEVSQC